VCGVSRNDRQNKEQQKNKPRKMMVVEAREEQYNFELANKAKIHYSSR